MREHRVIRSKSVINIGRKLTLCTLAAGMGICATAVSDVPMPLERMMVVDCLLPGQVRKLGFSGTSITARHAIKSVASECEIRGGEYVAYDRANFATSLQVWLPQAKDGDPLAAVYVGEIYEKGLGTAPDYAQAAFWYQKAADKGFARGLSELAYLYERGLGVPKDPVKALNLYRQSTGIKDNDLTFTSEVTAAKEEAASQISVLTQQLDASNAQAETLRQELDLAQSDAAAKNTALREAQAQARTLRQRVEAQKAQASTSPAERAELKRLQDALAASEAKVADAQRATQALQAANDAKSAELNERIQKAAAEDAQLRAQLGGHAVDAQQARADLAAAQARIESMNQQVQQLKQQIDSERSAVAAEQDKIAKRSTSQGDALNDELMRLRLALSDRESRLAQQQALLAAVQTQRESANSDVARLKTHESELEKQQSQQQVDNSTLRAQISSLQQKLLQSQQQLQTANTAVNGQKTQIDAEREQLGKSLEGTASQQAEIKNLKANVQDREAKLLGQQQQIAALQAQSHAYQDDIAKLQSQQQLGNGTLRAQISSLQQKLLQSQQQLQAAGAAAAGQKTQIEAGREQISKSQEGSAAQQGEIKSLRASVQERETKLLAQQQQIAALQAQSRTYQDDIAKLQSVGTRGVPPVEAAAAAAVSAHIPAILPKDLNLGSFYALIIGNDDYKSLPKLKSAVSDAHAVERVLREHYGFKTRVLENVGIAEIFSALNDYQKSLGERDSFLIYYAGHGALNEHTQLGYWLPVTATRDDPPNLWISDGQIAEQIERMAAKHILIIADSCYSGAMTRDSEQLTATMGRSTEMKPMYLLKTEAKLLSRTVLTSGGIEPVLDGSVGSNSIFARSLTDALARNEGVLEGTGLWKQVFTPVHKAAAQSPRYAAISYTGHNNGEFLLIPVS